MNSLIIVIRIKIPDRNGLVSILAIQCFHIKNESLTSHGFPIFNLIKKTLYFLIPSISKFK